MPLTDLSRPTTRSVTNHKKRDQPSSTETDIEKTAERDRETDIETEIETNRHHRDPPPQK